MSDSEQYHIETSDAGASATIPMEAGQIKKGGESEGIFVESEWNHTMASHSSRVGSLSVSLPTRCVRATSYQVLKFT
eukprot:scaffold32944_cov83-Cyclotella_meneghiniana.AAC.6